MASRERLEQMRPAGADERARGLVSSRTSGKRVYAARYAPPPALQAVIETMWVGAWDLRGQEPHTTELLSDPSVHVVFESGCPPRVVGLWTTVWERLLYGRGHVRAAKLRPGAVRAFFDRPAADLTDRRTPLSDLLHVPDQLADAVVLADDERVGVLALSDWLETQAKPVAAEVTHAMALVERCRTDEALTRVERLARDEGLTVRAVQRLFREHVGASPKWVLRRFRLQEAATRAQRREGTLTELAHHLGYADQAHLARDFKNATGKTLTTLRQQR